uniref:C2H2-type domain-containing protein n=1 Tax=Globodera rostochiensis TaxID=31243 RepID=A0A914GSR7_GLORO
MTKRRARLLLLLSSAGRGEELGMEEDGKNGRGKRRLLVDASSSPLKRPDLKGTFRCSYCLKQFCHSSSLSRHRMQAHFRRFRCAQCRIPFGSELL